MGSGIMEVFLGIALCHDDVAVFINQNRSERSVALFPGLACDLIGGKKIFDMVHGVPLYSR